MTAGITKISTALLMGLYMALCADPNTPISKCEELKRCEDIFSNKADTTVIQSTCSAYHDYLPCVMEAGAKCKVRTLPAFTDLLESSKKKCKTDCREDECGLKSSKGKASTAAGIDHGDIDYKDEFPTSGNTGKTDASKQLGVVDGGEKHEPRDASGNVRGTGQEESLSGSVKAGASNGGEDEGLVLGNENARASSGSGNGGAASGSEIGGAGSRSGNAGTVDGSVKVGSAGGSGSAGMAGGSGSVGAANVSGSVGATSGSDDEGMTGDKTDPAVSESDNKPDEEASMAGGKKDSGKFETEKETNETDSSFGEDGSIKSGTNGTLVEPTPSNGTRQNQPRGNNADKATNPNLLLLFCAVLSFLPMSLTKV